MDDPVSPQPPQDNAVSALACLISSIDESNSTTEEKIAAKSKIAAFLHGAISTVTEGGARALIERLKG